MIPDPVARTSTFDAVVRTWAETRPDARAFVFLGDGQRETERRTYGELDRGARRVAEALRLRGAVGERALLLYAPGLDFIEAFIGCLYAGVVAVPVYPPDPARLQRTLPRLRAVAANARARFILTTAMVEGMAVPMLGEAPELCTAEWIATDGLGGDPAFVDPGNTPSSVAFLQYTSGSTGTPRGVRLTHGNLLHNERGIRRAFGSDRFECIGFGWLPMVHDMGLIGKVLQTAYLGSFTALMSPLTFLHKPVRWLQAIDTYRATTSGGPNFAYELLTRKVTDAELDALDLSSWRVAFCGAEPIHRDTLRRFAERFARCGFDAGALFPCYGLAESTLMVSGGWQGRGASEVDLRAEALERGEALDAAPGTLGSTPVVGCGGGLAGLDLRVVEPENGQPVPQGRVGEIWVRGDSVADGYWDDAEATNETFGARLPDGTGPFLRTGDLGFVRDGELFVTGRRKDLLILRGRNLYPQDVEATVTAAHPAVRAGCVAAFCVARGTEEVLAVVAELSSRDPAEPEDVAAAVRRCVAAEHDLSIAELAFVSPRALPKTSSGKLQRRGTRSLLLEGGLTPLARWRDGQRLDAAEAPEDSALYAPPSEYFERLEARKPHYRFDLDADVAWDRCRESGLYFTRDVLGVSGIDPDAMATVPGLHERFQWALAVAICEEFVALERRIIGFLRDERGAGRLPASLSVNAFDEEEIKHVRLFRRYADELKAQHPQWATELDRHLRTSFATAWWWSDGVADYPDPAVYHYVTWLHFLYFEEYSIYLHDVLARGEGVQPSWLSAHAAHMREETQHVLTDAAHVERLGLDLDRRVQWSQWFLEHSASDASGLAGLEGVWTWLLDAYPALETLPQPASLLSDRGLRKRAFVRLLEQGRAFTRTRAAAPGYDAFVEATRAALATPLAPAAVEEPASRTALEVRIRDHLREGIAQRVGQAPQSLSLDAPLMYLGLDSVQVVELSAELEALAGRSLPPTLLYEHPTIGALARAVATEAGAAPPALTDRSADLTLDDDVFEVGEATPERTVLVTGATGFLCSFLLAELLRHPGLRAVCLVRASDPDHGLDRLCATMERHGLWSSDLAARIEVLPGDLARPQLGLSESDFARLSGRLDAIYHGGAVVDFVQPYERLKAVNVGGTKEILRLAFRAGKIPLHFVSTIAIFDTRDQTGRATAREDQRPDGAAGFRNGYAESKWVAEQLVEQAAQRGLPTRIYRPGVVSGSTVTGAWQHDLVVALLSTFASEGVAIRPAAQGSLDGAPVDYVARAIVHIARKPETVGGIFHLTNPEPTRWVDVYAAMGELGWPVETVDYEQWLARLEAHRDGHPLAGYLGYFRARSDLSQLRMPAVDHRQTEVALSGSDICCRRLDAELLALYFDYFARVGLLATNARTTMDGGHDDTRSARA